VAGLKPENGAGLLVAGSGALVRLLAEHDLVDEYRLWIHPVIIGMGQRLFPERLAKSCWRLAHQETTGKGAAVLTYRKAPCV
jgi:dihydrofolate reductase